MKTINTFQGYEGSTIYSPGSHLNDLTLPPLIEGCSEGLDAFRFFFKLVANCKTETIMDDASLLEAFPNSL